MDAREWQIAFFEYVRKKLDDPPGFSRKIAEVLGMGVPNVYKRLSGELRLRFDEMLLICQTYGISIDQWVGINQGSLVTFQFSGFIKDEADLMEYAQKTYYDLSRFANQEHRFYYAARDMPLFLYSLDESLLRFKLAIWLDGLEGKRRRKSLDLRFDENVLQPFRELGKLYMDLNTTELWTARTVVNVLKQIESTYYSKTIATSYLLEVIRGLEKVLNQIFKSAASGKKRFGTLELYETDYLMMTNGALLVTPGMKTAYTSYAGVNYFRTENPAFTEHLLSWFKVNLDRGALLNKNTPSNFNKFQSQILWRIRHLEQSIEIDAEDFSFDL